MSAPSNTFEGRWRWYYSAIADFMIANPGASNPEIAAHVRKHPNTVSMIMNTDLFKGYFAERKREWRERHDDAILQKTANVAMLALGLMEEHMIEKRTKVPFRDLSEVSSSALERLGYGTKAQAPAVQINSYGGAQQVLVPVGAGALEEAREIMRQAEARRAIEARERQALPAIEFTKGREDDAIIDAVDEE